MPWCPRTNHQLWVNRNMVLCVSLGKGKAKGVNPDRKSRVEPLRRMDGVVRLLPACPADALVPNCIDSSSPVESYQQRLEGSLDVWAEQGLHIPSPSPCSTLERTLQLITVISSIWRRKGAPRISQRTVEETIASHWIATARLKLRSPQLVRCCPATACRLHWVREAKNSLDKQAAIPYRAEKQETGRRSPSPC